MGDSQTKQFGTKFVDQLSGELDKDAPFFNKSMFTGAGAQTRGAWDRGRNQAVGLDQSNGFANSQRSAMDSLNGVQSGYAALGDNNGLTGGQQGNIDALGGLGQGYAGLSGAYDQEAPGYARMRQSLMDDAIKNVGAGFTQSGRFGGGSYIDTATEGALDAIAPLDYQNFQNGINNQYRSLDSQAGIQRDQFGMSQQGIGNQFGALAGQGATAQQRFGMGQQALDNENAALGRLGSLGAAQDADAQGRRLGNADLFDRRNNGGLDRLLKIGSGFGGATADAANEPPWWQQALGYVANNAGKAASAWWG